jgi:alkyl sulfatase BDS1-like metallo-beta-lactamase superfamily hydrolase
MARAMSITQLFDTIAIRIDGPRAAATSLSVLWDFTDTGKRYLMRLSNGLLVHHPTNRTPHVDLTVRLTRAQLIGLLSSGSLDGVETAGDAGVLRTLMGLTDEPDPDFAVVTP